MATAKPRKLMPQDDYQRLKDRCRRLDEQNRQLQAKVAEYKDFVKKAVERCHESKERAKGWQLFAESNRCPSCRERNPGQAKSSAPPRLEQDARRVTSSQTTEAEVDDTLTDVGNFPDEHQPEVVSARSLKRKQQDQSGATPSKVHIKLEPCSPGHPIQLDSQDYSSPRAKRRKPMRTETSDLNVVDERHDTPHRQDTWRALTEDPPTQSKLLQQASSLSEGNLPGRLKDEIEIKAEPMNQARANSVAGNDPPAKCQVAQTNILHQRSINIQDMPATSSDTRRVKEHKRGQKVAILSEAGDHRGSQNVGKASEINATHTDDGRLDALLGAPSSSDKQPLPKRPTPDPKPKPIAKKPSPIIKPQRSTPKVKVEQHSSPLRRNRERDKSAPPAPKPEEEPLRVRPLDRLCLDDFKINVNYMGSDFAFADTIRGREQRRCMPGCTRPECCGHIQRAVEMGLGQSTKSDHEVLQEYLGPDFAALMQGYGPSTRKDVLVKARAFAFANEHGKHRQAFQRHSTPPGFWRIDMPSTQEAEQDRQRAVRLERERVEDRWREAMRGGRWLFKDE